MSQTHFAAEHICYFSKPPSSSQQIFACLNTAVSEQCHFPLFVHVLIGWWKAQQSVGHRFALCGPEVDKGQGSEQAVLVVIYVCGFLLAVFSPLLKVGLCYQQKAFGIC